MNLVYVARQIQNRICLPFFILKNSTKEHFTCPICGYSGPFRDFGKSRHIRKNATCPKCGAAERHRLQYLALCSLLDEHKTGEKSMLHFAPEPFFQIFFSKRFGTYETADLSMQGVDHKADLQSLPFKDKSYDFVFASHVLEHVIDDNAAIAEIRRILKPGGIAVLPVPLVAEKTVEYPEPNKHEDYHVRAPGFDYFDKYARHFSRVEQIDSYAFPEQYQLFIHSDRTGWPTDKSPLRPPMKGEKHVDIVPVCYA
jgi:SAM-dependent methyltransferase